MKRTLLLVYAFFMCALGARAQTPTLVTGTVTDSGGVAYAFAKVSAQLVPTTGSPTIIVGGIPVQIGGQQNANADANGNFTMNLFCNSAGGGCSVISPSGTQWLITVNETGTPPPLGTGPQVCSATLTITGASQSVTSSFNACPKLSASGIGGGGTPAAPASSLQYNNGGSFGGSSIHFTPNHATCSVNGNFSCDDYIGPTTNVCLNAVQAADAGVSLGNSFDLCSMSGPSEGAIIAVTSQARGAALFDFALTVGAFPVGANNLAAGGVFSVGDDPLEVGAGQTLIGVASEVSLSRASGNISNIEFYRTGTPGASTAYYNEFTGGAALAETVTGNVFGYHVLDLQGRGTTRTAGIQIDAQTNCSAAPCYAIKVDGGGVDFSAATLSPPTGWFSTNSAANADQGGLNLVNGTSGAGQIVVSNPGSHNVAFNVANFAGGGTSLVACTLTSPAQKDFLTFNGSSACVNGTPGVAFTDKSTVNTTSYNPVSLDRGNVITRKAAGAMSDLLAQAGSAGFGSNWYTRIYNVDTANSDTLTATTSTINGIAGATGIVITPNTFCDILSDNTNYRAACANWVVAGTNITAVYNANGSVTFNASGSSVFPLTVSGTVTSGGIPYFSSTTQESSSGLLTQYGVVFGGGAGGAPTSSGQGAANMPLIGQGAANPIFSSIAYPTSLTSGGALYASSTTAIAGGGILNVGVLTMGGGAGAAPTNTLCDQGQTTANVLTCTQSAGAQFTAAVKVGTAPATTFGTGGGLSNTEGTIATGLSTADTISANSTLHCYDANFNNVEMGCLVGAGGANTAAAAMTLDMSAATGATAFKVPVIAGATAGANGVIDYDSTAGNTHLRTNAADSLAVAEAAALAANTIPKATDATHSLLTASSITDDGTQIATSEVIRAGNTATVTSNFTTASTSLVTITGLTWSLPATAHNYNFFCRLSYSQATAAAANAFGVQAATTAPTNLYAAMLVSTNLTSATAWVDATLPTLNTTTATNIGTFTPGAFGAIGTVADIFTAQIWGYLEQGAGATTLNIMALSGSASDSLTIYRGSSCTLLP